MRKHLGFKIIIVAGFLLGVGLLVQTISTYVYVSGNLVRQEAQREAGRKVVSIERAIRAARTTDPAAIASIMDESLKEWQGQVAWMHLVDSPANRDRVSEVRDSDTGKVLVTLHPLRAGSRQQPPMMVEIATSLDGISASFASLRRNLIIGVSASLALLGSMVLLVLRFPNYVRGKQLEHELRKARGVQAALLPKSRATGNIDFAVQCVPASEVGGDVCDFFEVDRGRTAFVLGDVCGKGMSAALLMGLIHGAVHSSAWTGSTRDHEDASERLNDLLRRKTSADRFATLFWGYYEPDASVLRYVNAGHLPQLLIRRGEGTELQIQRLDTGGPVLGVVDWGNYRQGEASVQEGDLLVLFSDGISEAMNAAEEQFGEDRLLKAIDASWDGSPAEIRNAILRHLGSHVGAAAADQDDQTLVVARFQHVYAAPGLETGKVYASLTN